MEDRIAKLEKNFETDIIKSIAKKLLVESIYSTHEELRETTREFMSSEHPDFLKKFKKNQWQIYYKKNIAQLLLAKHRSIREMLTARIKNAIFSVFSKFPPINTSTKELEIKKWKGMQKIAKKNNFLYSDEYEMGSSSQEEANEIRITKTVRLTINEIDIEERESEKKNEKHVESKNEEKDEEH
ncbi:hypothetical protein C1646_760458 [Rhizophagus diaphanus]|nr:hypothetical protein C1646_760458 [Rhizophagus diaphanus] [Rhizophagus sp. MUCL 43196]